MLMKKNTSGFTLVEMAMVLMIVGLLLGGLLPTISSQMELQQTRETRKLLDEIQQALIGFAIANGRLPCPATSASNGEESPVGGGNCTNFYDGYVPAATLGITSVDNNTKLVIDAWNNPIRYAVASNTVSGVSNTFTSTDGMKNATMSNIAGANLLNVCASATGITGSDCGIASNKLTDKVPALVYSTGKNRGYGGGLDEAANLDGNRVFASHTPTPGTATNGEFDDLMIWLSPNILFNRMVAAGNLP